MRHPKFEFALCTRTRERMKSPGTVGPRFEKIVGEREKILRLIECAAALGGAPFAQRP
jgi:hypothetical protein